MLYYTLRNNEYIGNSNNILPEQKTGIDSNSE